MSLASLTNIEKTFGKRVIFDHLNLTIYEGERIGFIGANGAGKTTLFRIIKGEVTPDLGTVAVSKGVKVGYLAQDPVFDDASTVIDEAEAAFGELHSLAHRLRDIEHEMADAGGEALTKILEKYQETQHDFELAGGYSWRHRLEATLLGVGLDPSTWEQKVPTLSGGQRSRLALARLLISEPDLLLLDEPTNHLDLAAIEWLEEYLRAFKGAVVVISHDRFLLDRLATRIVWLNRCQLDSFKGNYSAFVQQKELLELTQQRAFDKQREEIAKQEEFIRRFQAGQRAREAQGRKKRLERFVSSDAMVQQVAGQHHIKLSLNTDQRAGDQVLLVKGLSKAFGEKKLWDDLEFLVRRGERVGIIGPNGSGKTTLLKVLLAEEDADDGELRWGANLNIGYYDQRLDQFEPENTVEQEVLEGRANTEASVTAQDLRNVLATMLFRGDDIYKPVGLLSGGERARVRLAQLLLDKPNVLVLDEPTNHLDIASCEALESTLSQFAGTLLFVSHDRYFLDKVAQRLLILEPPALRDFAGNYSALRQKERERAAEEASRQERTAQAHRQAQKRQQSPKPAAQQSKKKDNPYARPFGRLSMEELEKEIQKAERELARCQREFANSENFKDGARGQRVKDEFDAATERLQRLEEEYFARET